MGFENAPKSFDRCLHPPDDFPARRSRVRRRLSFRPDDLARVLENYLSRSISMEGLLNGRGNFDDDVRMLKHTGAKFIGRSLCLWGGEANFLRNIERARQEIPKVHEADPDMILQACVFEIVTTQVEQIPVPDWVFTAFGQPVEKRNFRYADMIYPPRQRHDWGRNGSVPDVSRPETQLWFYYQAASYIDAGCEAIHFGQVELMNHNDRDLAHWSQLLALVRAYAADHARRHMVLCDGHVPSGGLVRDGKLLLDFHSFPLRIMEVPDKPQEAILKVGFSDGIYGRSKGGIDLQRLAMRAFALSGGDRQLRRQAGSRASRKPAAFGSGATTKSPGSPSKAKSIATTGCDTPGIGCARPIRTAISKCPAAARSVRRSTESAGITRTIAAKPRRRVSGRKKPSAKSGPAT